MTFPLSLKPQERLKTDSARSPIILAVVTTTASIISFTKLHCPKRSLKNTYLLSIAKRIVPRYAPINPATLLLGLTAIIPLLFFPNNIPISHAAESLIKTRITNRHIICIEWSKTVSRDIKVGSKPLYAIVKIPFAILMFDSEKSFVVNASTAKMTRHSIVNAIPTMSKFILNNPQR